MTKPKKGRNAEWISDHLDMSRWQLRSGLPATFDLQVERRMFHTEHCGHMPRARRQGSTKWINDVPAAVVLSAWDGETLRTAEQRDREHRASFCEQCISERAR